MRVVVGGVGYRFQRDLSFGLHVSDALGARADLEGIEVVDLGYGALFVAQELAAVEPAYDRVVLVAAAVRGRPPGLYERRGSGAQVPPDEIQERIREAGAGVIDLDHLLVIGRHFEAYPADLRVLELEPVDCGSGDGLSPIAARLLPEAVARARAAALDAAPAART